MTKTERLYYNDPHLLEFDATVIEQVPLDGRVGAILDRTAFYPTSGGQPNDLGWIENIAVVDVYEDEDSGAIIHVTDEPLPNRAVHGRIDAARRLDHMQQHSGQHVLSQAFVELFGWKTVSFHLGSAFSTIDLAVENATRDQTTRAEELANAIVQENRSVAICYVPSERIHEVGLRKPTQRSGEIRVIDIAGYDKSACGGTHVRSTAEIGPMLITRLERAKRQTRIEFLCGGRVIRYAREANRALEAISQIVSTPPLESASGVKMVWDELQRARKRVDELELRQLDVEAAEFPVRDGVATGAFKGRGIETIKVLAQKICLRPGIVALLADESDQIRVVFARAADSSVDVASILRQTLERFGGRGGGKPNLAQGGGLTGPDAQTILDYARNLLKIGTTSRS
jgi:alanyl-tRNA synthetase